MPLPNLLIELLDDIRHPAILWQVLAITACIGLGWSLARLIHRYWLHGREGHGVLQFGVEGFGRVLGPLLIVSLLALAKQLLAHYQSVNLLRVALPLFLSLAVIRGAIYLLRRVFARHQPLSSAMLQFEKGFALVVWLGVALHITGILPEVIDLLEGTRLPLGRHKVSLADVLQGGVSVVVLMMLALWAGAALEERLMGLESMHSSLRMVMARMSRAVLILIAVLFGLSLAGLDLTVLSVFGGALGVGLGLGMQRIASNYVSGFIILIERSLMIGDPISIDKYSGKIARINTRYTVLRGLDGTQTLLPNEMLITAVVLNQSAMNRNARVATRVIVSYDSDLARIMPLLEAQAKGVPRVLDEPAPGALLNGFASEGYDLELGFWIADPENGQGGVISDVNKKIYGLVRSGEIKLGHPVHHAKLLDAHLTSVLPRIPQNVPD